MTPEELETFRALHDEIEALGTEARLIEKHEETQRDLATLEERTTRPQLDEDDSEKRERATGPTPADVRAALNRYLRGTRKKDGSDERILRVGQETTGGGLRLGEDEESIIAQVRGVNLPLGPALTPEERMIFNPARNVPPEQRILNITTNTEGQHTVPNAAMRPVEEAMLSIGGWRQTRAEIIRTSGGNPLPIPTDNDTANAATILAEGVSNTTSVDPVFGQVVLGAYKFHTLIRFSLEFMMDTSLDLAAYLMRKIGIRFARGTNTQFTVGDGTTEPNGGLWAASIGYNAASASAIAYTDLTQLEHSVDPDERANAEWQFNDQILRALKELSVGASDARPLWLPGIAVRAPDTILGYSYSINQAMPSTIAGDTRTVIFGNHSAYKIREVRDLFIARLVERFMDEGEIGYWCAWRQDGDLVDPASNKLRVLRHPAS